MKHITKSEMGDYIKNIEKRNLNLMIMKCCFYIEKEELRFKVFLNEDFYSDIKEYDNIILLESIIKKYISNEYTFDKVVNLCCNLINYMINSYNANTELYKNNINDFIDKISYLKGQELKIIEIDEKIIETYNQCFKIYKGNIKKIQEDSEDSLKVYTYTLGKNREIKMCISFYRIQENKIIHDSKIKITTIDVEL